MRRDIRKRRVQKAKDLRTLISGIRGDLSMVLDVVADIGGLDTGELSASDLSDLEEYVGELAVAVDNLVTVADAISDNVL